MSSTINLQSTTNFVSMFARLAPPTGVGGFINEPTITMANLVRGFILGAPFAWRWNRNTTSFTATIAAGQDYVKNLPDFGWLEKASANNGTTVHELEVSDNLAEESQQNQLFRISARLDDDSGNITFRLMPAPEQQYTINISYQKAAPTFQSLGDLWSPIPDYLSYIYTQGMLAKMYEYMDDPRFAYADQRFLKMVIANNSGLQENQVSIFLGERIDILRQQQQYLGRSQSGLQGRSGL